MSSRHDVLQDRDYRQLFEDAPALMLVLSPDLVILGATDGYLNTTKTRRNEIVGRHLFDVFPDNPNDLTADGVSKLGESLRIVLETRQSHTMATQKYDIRTPAEDGGHFVEKYWSPINSPVLDEQGRVARIIHRVEDVTDLILSQRERDARIAELDRFFNVTLDLLCISHADGYFKRLSPAFTVTLGWDLREMLTRPYVFFIHPEDLEKTKEAVQKQIAAGEPILQFENRYLHKDGTYRTLSWKSVPQAGGFMYAAARDITERIKMEEDLRSAKDEADRANLAKSEFLSRMSHELRTPLHSVLGFAQFLELQYSDPQILKATGSIIKGGKHLLTMIDEILDLSRIESGRLAISLEPVSVPSVLAHAAGLVKPIVEKANIELVIPQDLQDDTYVLADKQRLVQVILNLLSNGAKFNQPGGKITVECAAAGDQVLIEVVDTGRGIAAEDQKDLFQPFRRFGDQSVEGTGLGLAVSRTFVEKMGGALELVESSSAGSRFRIALKSASGLIKEDFEEPIQKRLASIIASKSGTVLYVEDNAANNRLMEMVFSTGKDLRLIVATTGLEGVRLAETEMPDLILLDLNLPDIDGDKVLEKLLSSSLTREIPVIILSADATSRQREKLLAAGAKEYLTKPVEVDRLLALVDAYLPDSTSIKKG